MQLFALFVVTCTELALHVSIQLTEALSLQSTHDRSKLLVQNY